MKKKEGKSLEKRGEQPTYIGKIYLLLERIGIGLKEVIPEIVDQLELRSGLHAFVDDLFQATARGLAQINLIQAEREELEELVVDNKVDFNPGNVGAHHLQGLTRDLGILIRVLLEQQVPGLDQVVDGGLADRVFVERDQIGLLLRAQYFPVDHFAVDGHEEFEVEVGVAYAPRAGGDQVGEEGGPPGGKVNEAGERKELSGFFCEEILLVGLATHLTLQPEGHEALEDVLVVL